MKNFLSLFTFILLTASHLISFAQIAIGEWRDHLPYSFGVKVAEANNKIYCATDVSLFFYNKTDNSLEKLSKITGLSDIGIKAIKYNSDNDVLLIAYSNANIDLVNESFIYNISDIKRFTQIIGSKTINNILFINDYAYLSCGFGIVVLDIVNREIKDTYYIGDNGDQIEVCEIAFDGTYLYAATEKGIYKADINNSNLINFANWSKITNIPHYYRKFNSITYFNNKIYYNLHDDISENDTIFVYDDSLSTYFSKNYSGTNHALTSCYDNLIVVNEVMIDIFDLNENIVQNISDYWGSATPRPRHAIVDTDGLVWVADEIRGVLRIEGEWSFQTIYPNGPLRKEVVDISIEQNNLWATYGGRTTSWGNLWNKGVLYTFIDEEWGYYNSFTTPELHNLSDLVKVRIDPSNPNHVFVASWSRGVLEFNNGELVEVYNEENSSLQDIFTPGNDYIRIGGITFDDNNNLWVTNTGVPNPLSVRQTNGAWKSFSFGNILSSMNLGDVIVTDYGHKWIIVKGNGIFAFTDNGTIGNTDDDDFKKFYPEDEDGKLITTQVYAIVEDNESTIWIGTDEGILVYYNPENVFSEQNFYARKIIIEMDSLATYLLATEIVTAISVDGANRKWIGTERSGAFLVSEDGTEQLLNFNLDNSPLPSNNIICIAINDDTGEVFFGTENGIVSYKGTATEGDDDYNQVYVYPNPVREDFEGVITVTGLVTDSNVKITDISGNIVYETTSEGGQAIWDGKNFNGKKVHTGVYLVFCTNDDGSKTHVTKLLFIN